MGNPIDAGGVTARKIEWLWRDRIPKGMITVVAGKPDQGKGLFSAHVAAAVSQRGGNVLYSAIEDDHSMMTRPRLEAAGADLSKIKLWRFALPAQQLELEKHVFNNEIDLVVMDPFNAHLSGGVSRFSDNIRQLLSPLSRLAEESGCSILITEHALKRVAESSHPLNAIGGSGSGLPAAARMGFLFGVDPDDGDRRILAAVKSNLRESPKALAFEVDTEELPVVGEVPMILVEGEEEFDPRRLLTVNKPGKVGRRPDKREQSAEWLTEYMAIVKKGVPVKSGVLMEDAKQAGMPARTVRRAADDMGVLRNPPGGGRNCTWSLPNEVKAVMGLPVELVEEGPKLQDGSFVVNTGTDIDEAFADLLGDGDE